MKWISNNNKVNIWKNWNWFFQKKLIQLKPHQKLIKNKNRGKNTKIKNERRASPIDPIDIRRIIRKNYRQLCANNFNNIDKVDNSLKMLFPKWIQEEIYNLNKSICVIEIEFVALRLWTKCYRLIEGGQMGCRFFQLI